MKKPRFKSAMDFQVYDRENRRVAQMVDVVDACVVARRHLWSRIKFRGRVVWNGKKMGVPHAHSVDAAIKKFYADSEAVAKGVVENG